MNLSRRSLFAGAAAFICAPAIVRVASIMPISAYPRDDLLEFTWRASNGGWGLEMIERRATIIYRVLYQHADDGKWELSKIEEVSDAEGSNGA